MSKKNYIVKVMLFIALTNYSWAGDSTKINLTAHANQTFAHLTAYYYIKIYSNTWQGFNVNDVVGWQAQCPAGSQQDPTTPPLSGEDIYRCVRRGENLFCKNIITRVSSAAYYSTVRCNVTLQGWFDTSYISGLVRGAKGAALTNYTLGHVGTSNFTATGPGGRINLDESSFAKYPIFIEYYGYPSQLGSLMSSWFVDKSKVK